MSETPPKKKRKVAVSSSKAPLSAFAARKALSSTKKAPSSPIADETPQCLQFPATSIDSNPIKLVGTHASSTDVPLEPKPTASKLDEAPFNPEDSQLSSFESRGHSPEGPLGRPSITLSNFKPDKNNVKLLSGDSITLQLAPGERLVILGQYELSVRKGQVTLLGAALQSSKSSYRVYASSTHALPVVRCLATDVNGANLRLRSCENGLRSLHPLSHLYGRLWNDHYGPLGPEYQHLVKGFEKSTFQILFSSKDAPQKAFLQPLISPPTWNEILAKCSTSSSNQGRRILICGPKSSGKSTLVKLLVNRLLSTSIETTRSGIAATNPGVALLDIDPGQPEYSPPGQLALVHVQDPNFGPPFAHPIPSPKDKILRSHSIGAISPALDPDLYTSCVLDLFAHYRNMLARFPECSLVINTPGWVLGTGLEILVDLIANVKPTEVIYMSKDGPSEVVESLGEAAASIPVTTLPSQTSEYTTRTAAHLRTMQYMSYFHMNSSREKSLTWNTQPLTSMPPWEISYSGDDPGIVGILCYGEQPPPDLIVDTINGSLVAIVVIDDMKAIPGWDMKEKEGLPNKPAKDRNASDMDFEHRGQSNLNPELQLPLILQTPEDIPYFNPDNAIFLDPKGSHSIGLALVRGIDVARKRIQVLTPIPPSEIEEINKARKSIVLVSGKLDTPGWAYTEELTQKLHLEKFKKKTSLDAANIDSEDSEDSNDGTDVDEADDQRNLEEGFKTAPWVERLEGHQGRGLGSRVWRVRRDLGKDGGG